MSHRGMQTRVSCQARVFKLKVVTSILLYHLLYLSVPRLNALPCEHLFSLTDEVRRVRAEVQGHIQVLLFVLDRRLLVQL